MNRPTSDQPTPNDSTVANALYRNEQIARPRISPLPEMPKIDEAAAQEIWDFLQLAFRDHHGSDE